MVSVHRAFDVLERLLTDVIESCVHLAVNLLEDRRADADTAWFGEGFQAGGDVYAVPIDIVSVDDDFPHIDADAEEKAFLFLGLVGQRPDRILNADGAMGGGDNACKACEN